MQGLVKTCLEMGAVDLTGGYSPALFNAQAMQLGLMGWHLDTKSRRDTCSSQLRSARPMVLIASPPCLESPSPLESEENGVIF